MKQNNHATTVYWRPNGIHSIGCSRSTPGLRPAGCLLAALLAVGLRRHPRTRHAGGLLPRFRPGQGQSSQTILHHHSLRYVWPSRCWCWIKDVIIDKDGCGRTWLGLIFMVVVRFPSCSFRVCFVRCSNSVPVESTHQFLKWEGRDAAL